MLLKFCSLFTFLIFFNYWLLASNTKPTWSYSISDNSFIDASYGETYLFYNDIYLKPLWGNSAIGQIRFDFLNKHLSVGPLINTKHYFSYLKGATQISYEMFVFKTGINIDVLLYKTSNEKFFITNYISFNYVWLDNRVTWDIKSAYAYYANNTSYPISREETFPIFNGDFYNISLGYRISYSFIFIKMGYDIINAPVVFTERYINVMKNMGINNPHEKNLQFNSFDISFGVSMPLISIPNIFVQPHWTIFI